MADTDHIHRNSAYRPDFPKIVEELAEAGATNIEIAGALGVTNRTISRWCAQHPLFSRALIVGRERAKARLARSLYESAVGFMAVREMVIEGHSGPSIQRVQEYHRPDPAAARIWMQRCHAGEAANHVSNQTGAQKL